MCPAVSITSPEPVPDVAPPPGAPGCAGPDTRTVTTEGSPLRATEATEQDAGAAPDDPLGLDSPLSCRATTSAEMPSPTATNAAMPASNGSKARRDRVGLVFAGPSDPFVWPSDMDLPTFGWADSVPCDLT